MTPYPHEIQRNIKEHEWRKVAEQVQKSKTLTPTGMLAIIMEIQHLQNEHEKEREKANKNFVKGPPELKGNLRALQEVQAKGTKLLGTPYELWAAILSRLSHEDMPYREENHAHSALGLIALALEHPNRISLEQIPAVLKRLHKSPAYKTRHEVDPEFANKLLYLAGKVQTHPRLYGNENNPEFESGRPIVEPVDRLTADIKRDLKAGKHPIK